MQGPHTEPDVLLDSTCLSFMYQPCQHGQLAIGVCNVFLGAEYKAWAGLELHDDAPATIPVGISVSHR